MTQMLSMPTLLKIVQGSFASIKDASLRERPISLKDCLLSAYAMFSLKYPSLLQFDQGHNEKFVEHNLRKVYGIEQVPCDTRMRERLDELDPENLRKAFKSLFAQCQRSKYLELFQYYNDRYLMPLDGTGFFHSKEVHCKNCCVKNHRDGSQSYYHQMLAGSIVHPAYPVVIPFAPEPIMKSDGLKKNDCERRAAERFLSDLKREHPHLKLIITGDGLFSNGPFIKRLKADNHCFILVAKEKDHKALFEEFCALPREHLEITQDKSSHRFEWINDLCLNDSHLDCRVNVLEYWETNSKGKIQHWVWVTNIELTQKNVYQIMKGGRARHKIENETFNTLKNQGYQFEHNFGHGEKQLSSVFAYLMMLAFFADQLSQLGCKLFKKALARLYSKVRLWERQRVFFFGHFVMSMEDMWLALAYGNRGTPLTPDTS